MKLSIPFVVLAGAALSFGAAPTVRGQAPSDSAARLEPLLELGFARALPATLADRQATGTAGTSPYHESVWLRLDGQWGLIAEARVPIGARRVWGIELY